LFSEFAIDGLFLESEKKIVEKRKVRSDLVGAKGEEAQEPGISLQLTRLRGRGAHPRLS
jgi:hypothetical protein